jgi:hypothetical protein
MMKTRLATAKPKAGVDDGRRNALKLAGLSIATLGIAPKMGGIRQHVTATARAAALTLGLTGAAMAQQQILISSEWGNVKADLVDNDATRSLVKMLPVTIEMRDHLRQEKTGDLPSPLAPSPGQTAFSKGTLGLWSADHFVIYYREGRVPQPGIVILGQVTEDVAIFDRPGAVNVRVELAPK